MKSIELRRHAEKDTKNVLSEEGTQSAKKLGSKLPPFSKVVSSDSDRARLTAKLITDIEPRVDARAAMWMTDAKSSDEINKIALAKDLLFLEAMEEYSNLATLEGTTTRARELDDLVSELFAELAEDERGLIVSHDLTINALMARRNLPLEALAPLEGYVLYENGNVIPASLD